MAQWYINQGTAFFKTLPGLRWATYHWCLNCCCKHEDHRPNSFLAVFQILCSLEPIPVTFHCWTTCLRSIRAKPCLATYKLAVWQHRAAPVWQAMGRTVGSTLMDPIWSLFNIKTKSETTDRKAKLTTSLGVKHTEGKFSALFLVVMETLKAKSGKKKKMNKEAVETASEKMVLPPPILMCVFQKRTPYLPLKGFNCCYSTRWFKIISSFHLQKCPEKSFEVK